MTQKKLTIGILQLVIVVGILSVCSSCGSSKKTAEEYLYFQRNMNSSAEVPLKERVIQPSDLLNIQVLSNSLNQEQTNIFNLSNTNTSANNAIINPKLTPGYLVSTSGEIEMPVIGKIKAGGLTKNELQDTILEKLAVWVKNPIVLIRFSDFTVNVLGEVKTPGIQSFQKDKVTIIDAISAAGDLTDYAKREDIIVIRDDGTKRKNYTVDLRDGSLFRSVAYQLQPNDIIYVGANQKKMKNLKNNAYNQKGLQIFLGVASITTALIYLVSTIANNN